MSRILVAEDDVHIAEMIVFTLTRAGHEVVHAADGGQAVLALDESSFDLVLLDLMMPVMSGLELLRGLKADRSRMGIPVVILSARSREKDVELGRAAGAVDYLTKPFSLSELVTRVERALQS